MATATRKIVESAPVDGVTCGRCKSSDALMYPSVGETGVVLTATICPNCSTPEVESLIRFAAESHGYTLGAATVFPQPVGPLAELAAIVPQLDDEDKRLLEEGWHATADGSNCTAEFGYDSEGRTTYQGKRPSFALALLFDRENFEAGRPTALPYWEAA